MKPKGRRRVTPSSETHVIRSLHIESGIVTVVVARRGEQKNKTIVIGADQFAAIRASREGK